MLKPLLKVCLVALLATVFVSTSHADDIWAEVDGHDVSVFHLGAYYNCCWILDADIVEGVEVIDLYEIEGEGSEYCYCFCYFDLSFHFEVTESGDYLLRVWYLVTEDYPYEYVLAAELPIHIDGDSDGSLFWVEQSPCGGWATSVPSGGDQPMEPNPETNWSALKTLYR